LELKNKTKIIPTPISKKRKKQAKICEISKNSGSKPMKKDKQKICEDQRNLREQNKETKQEKISETSGSNPRKKDKQKICEDQRNLRE